MVKLKPGLHESRSPMRIPEQLNLVLETISHNEDEDYNRRGDTSFQSEVKNELSIVEKPHGITGEPK